MPSLSPDFAPYTTSDLVLEVLRRFREYSLPDVLSVPALTQMGIPEGSASRVQQALRFLHLIDDEMRLTQEFRNLGPVSDAEYRQQLGEIIRASYIQVFKNRNPAECSDAELEDAFRYYEPRAQRRRMVSLFLALCREAGLVPEERKFGRSQKIAFVKRNATKPKSSPPSVKSQNLFSDNDMPETVEPTGSIEQKQTPQDNKRFDILHDFLEHIPADGRWTKPRKEQFVSAFTLLLDYLTETIDTDCLNQRGSAPADSDRAPSSQE